jgi:uncharacterized protein YndB with AHSA1/START domain
MSAQLLEQEAVQAMEIQKVVDIAAPIELAFESLLEELGPEAQMPDGKSLQMKIEPWPGGRWFRDLGDNAGHLWGHVQVIKAPTLLEICGPMAMSYPAVNHIQYRLKANGSGATQMTLHHRAMGLLVPDHRDGMDKGWGMWMDRIRALAERKARSGSRTQR